MTYREIFLQADPHVVHDALGTIEVEILGRKDHFITQGAFDICKGLRLYAQGEALKVSDEEWIQKILNDDNPQFKYTPKQAGILVRGLKGYLSAACEALGFNNTSNPDELVNEWLNNTTTSPTPNINQLAATIISYLITKLKK